MLMIRDTDTFYPSLKSSLYIKTTFPYTHIHTSAFPSCSRREPEGLRVSQHDSGEDEVPCEMRRARWREAALTTCGFLGSLLSPGWLSAMPAWDKRRSLCRFMNSKLIKVHCENKVESNLPKSNIVSYNNGCKSDTYSIFLLLTCSSTEAF